MSITVSHKKLAGTSQAKYNLTEEKPPTGTSESQKLSASHRESGYSSQLVSRPLLLNVCVNHPLMSWWVLVKTSKELALLVLKRVGSKE